MNIETRKEKEQIMKTITLNEMKKILDDTLSDLKSKKIKNANLVFYGEKGIGRRSVISEWEEKHAEEITCDYLTMRDITEEIENGWGEEAVTERPTYGIPELDFDCSYYLEEDNEDDELVHSYIVTNVNCARKDVAKKVKVFTEILKDRKYSASTIMSAPYFEINYDLHNVGLIIATAAIKGNPGTIAPIPEIEECSSVYNVFPSVEEFKEYFDEQTTTGKYKNEDKVKIEVFKKVLSSPRFKFISNEDGSFTPYKFISWFKYCDSGDKYEILSQLRSLSSDDPCDEVAEMFEKITLELEVVPL